MNKPTKVTRFLTKFAFDDLTECECGKKLFRYHNTSTNVFYAKCSNYDIKSKKNKLPVCGIAWSYADMRPVFKEIQQKLVFYNFKETNLDKILEEKLKVLFKFLYVSNHSSTLDEINILVKNSLKREPRKTFYYPSIGHFNRISHYEAFEDYEQRIFSKKIVDLNYITIPKVEQPTYFIESPFLPKLNKIKPVKLVKDVPKRPKVCNFINTFEEETEEKYNSESENSDYEDKENSDYEEIGEAGEADDADEEIEEIEVDEEIDEAEDYGDYDED
jgi:hypothetical protein